MRNRALFLKEEGVMRTEWILENNARCLGQARPATTVNVELYQPPVQKIGIVRWIVIANTSGAGATYRLFHDASGTTYSESTALAWNKAIAADTNELIEAFLVVNGIPSGSWGLLRGGIGVRTSVANALTFSIYGYEIAAI